MSNADKVEKLRAQAGEFHNAGRLVEAERLYRRVLELHRSDVMARYGLGIIHLQQNRPAEALALLEPLAAAMPLQGDVWSQCGRAKQELGRVDEALADFDRALQANPANALAWFYRGDLLAERGQDAQALECYQQLVQIAPGYGEAWFRRGNLLWRMDRLEEAWTSFRQALDCDPNRLGAAFNAGTVLLKLDRYDEAYAAFEKVAALAPGHPHVLAGLAGAVLGACDFDRWPDLQAQVVAAVRDKSATIVPLDFLPFCDDGSLRRRCSETFVADRVPVAATPIWTGRAYNHDRIRVAYLSADFRQHATAELIAGLIEAHDRTRFEIGAVSFGRDDDSAMRSRLAASFDWFEDVRLKSDAEVARWLAEREIDIAVDLKGHTQDSRPGILASRPCPVQVNYLGYPGTIGAPWLDYILADARVLPFDRQEFYSEKIVHLPHCYQVNDAVRAIGETPSRADAGLPPDGFVFCCFNAAWKISPVLFDVWMRLLLSAPGSVLWLLYDNLAAKRNLSVAAAARGVDARRLVFAPRLPGAAHLARHRLADLFLDTLPYNAHTTASDALWAGLPVLTCLGTQFDGRVAASLLETVGLGELVTHSMADYQSLARSLASDPGRLRDLRARLQANLRTSPLYDTDRFRRSLEAAYARMVETSRTGRRPESFAVAD